MSGLGIFLLVKLRVLLRPSQFAMSDSRVTSSFVNGRSENFIIAPSFIGSLFKRKPANSELPRPFRQTQSSAFKGQKAIISAILSLFARSAPLAICGPFICCAFFAFSARVMARNINPIQSHSNGTFSYISKKRMARFAPSQAHFCALGSISRIAYIAKDVASALGGSPRGGRSALRRKFLAPLNALRYFFGRFINHSKRMVLSLGGEHRDNGFRSCSILPRQSEMSTVFSN